MKVNSSKEINDIKYKTILVFTADWCVPCSKLKPEIEKLKFEIEIICKNFDTKGTILIAPEGINGTIEGSKINIDKFINYLKTDIRFIDLAPKFSYSSKDSFHRMKVRLKKEIVTIGDTNVNPNKKIGKYIDPLNWNSILSDPDTIIIDTRNEYEVSIGSFKGSINPKTKSFREFPKWVELNLKLKDNNYKDKKIAMFCTGGIRCEKATSYLVNQGFTDVSHLKGGILKYLEKVPKKESLWEGECFVFDQRVAVTSKLKEGKYDQCFACRHPLTPEEMQAKEYVEGISCSHCFNQTSKEKRDSLKERQKQIKLAKLRGEDHIGKKNTNKK